MAWIVITVSLIQFALATGASMMAVGDSCEIHADCNRGPGALHHSMCATAGLCQCVGGYFPSEDDRSCFKPALGDSCTGKPDQFCSLDVANSECNGEGLCACEDKHYRVDVDKNSFCYPVLPGAPCDSSSGAGNKSCSSDVRGGLYCDPINNECACSEGYLFSGPNMACVKGSKSDECSTCMLTSGECYDLDLDGVGDGCECPSNKESSDPADMSAGCDVGKAEIGDFCDPEGLSIVCYRANSHCVHVGDLSRDYNCVCKPGFVAVPVPDKPGEHQCVYLITTNTDPNCQRCERNNGRCYDVDGDDLRDGCLCPFEKSSSDSEDYNTDCDTSHLNIQCSSTTMTVCFVPRNTSDSDNVSPEDLVEGRSLIFVEGTRGKDRCAFQNTADGWCVTLSLKKNEYRTCRTRTVHQSRSQIRFENRVIIQKSLQHRSANDILFDVFCKYHTTVHAASKDGSGVGVKGHTRKSSAGLEIIPDLTFLIKDEFDRDATKTGIKLGSPTKLIVEMNDNEDIYVAMKAETCIATSEPTLASPTARSVMLLFNGCPTLDGYMDDEALFHQDPNDNSRMVSGLFPIFKFEDSESVYFHCSVKVCREAKLCIQSSCEANRKRRALSSFGIENSSFMTESLHSDAVLVLPKDGSSSKRSSNRVSYTDRESNELTLSGRTLTFIIIGLVAAVVIITALALVAIVVIKSSASTSPRPQALSPPSSDC